MCPADLLVPKQLPTVKAIGYRAVTFMSLFRIKLTRNNHCERVLIQFNLQHMVQIAHTNVKVMWTHLFDQCVHFKAKI